MPMHNWNLVPAGIFHDVHNAWLTHLSATLNAGLLPTEYYALSELRSCTSEADVLLLYAGNDEANPSFAPAKNRGGMLTVDEAPPKVRVIQEAQDIVFYLAKQRALVIRHVSGDRVVAMIEIVSPANKHSRDTLEALTKKAVVVLQAGVHLLVIDPIPPTRHDPNGMHGLIWERLQAGQYTAPSDMPLTLVSYCAKLAPTAYVEPFAAGSALTDMPLFLSESNYVPVPLEATYAQSWNGVPQRWRRVLEG